MATRKEHRGISTGWTLLNLDNGGSQPAIQRQLPIIRFHLITRIGIPTISERDIEKKQFTVDSETISIGASGPQRSLYSLFLVFPVIIY